MSSETDVQKLLEKKNVKGLLKALENGEAEVKKAAKAALVQIGGPKVLTGIIEVISKSKDIYNILPAIDALKELDGYVSVVELFIKDLTKGKQPVREKAAEVLGVLGDIRAVVPLIATLKDPIPVMRIKAAYALGKIGDVQAVEALIAALKNELGEGKAAAQALGEIGDRRAVEPLIGALHNMESNVRSSAAHALGELGDAKAVEPLISVLLDLNYEVRIAAVLALVKIGDNRAVEPLIAILRNSTGVFRIIVINALGKIGDHRALGELAHISLDFSDLSASMDASAAIKKIEERGIRTVIDNTSTNDNWLVNKTAIPERDIRTVVIDNTSINDNWLINKTIIPVTVACKEMFGTFTVDLNPGETKRLTFNVKANVYPHQQYSYDDLKYEIGKSEKWEISDLSGQLELIKLDV